MSEDSDDSSKTEEPSQKKLDEARKKGQIPASRELNHFFMMLAATFFVFVLGPHMALKITDLLAPFITKPEAFEMSAAGVSMTLNMVVFGMLGALALPFLLTFAGALAPAVLQRKMVISGEHIKPKLSKISPLAGVKRIFGMKALIEFIKNFIKICVVGIIIASVAMPYREQLPQLLHSPNKLTMFVYAEKIAGKILIAVCIFLFLLSIVDYLYQRFTIMKSLRMSKQEMKDEYKQQEGDPHVKQKIRQMRRERAKKRMMANVPKADVIITNPTHFAVALKYDAATMAAPKVLAKGADEVAARIRELATKHKVPIVRNPPLARILYDTAEIDEAIPVEHYQAVAKIIGYVYRLKGKTPGAPPPKGKGGKTKMPTLKMKK
ncbi:MAG: flagellar biosynthesis protein FlhB [Pseudomonadota bacterium]